MNYKKNVAVIFGGKSSEHDISIITGLQVLGAINKNKYNVLPIYINRLGQFLTGEPLAQISTYNKKQIKQKGVFEVSLLASGNYLYRHHKNALKKWLKLDCVVLSMHGVNGEDGSLQGLLELCNIPYTSSGVVSSGVCMDKVIMKRLFESLHLPIVPWFYVTRNSFLEQIDKIDEQIKASFLYPVIVKPANLGSSIGIAVCNNKDELLEGLTVASEFDYKIIIEQCITNLKEVNCSVLGFQDDIKTSSLEEPVSYKEFLNFDEKYLQGKTKNSGGMASLTRILPANISKSHENKIKELAKKVFYELDCAGVVRIDFMIDKKINKIFVNEVNTIPGSLAFYLWEHDKVYFSVLIDKLINLAYEKHLQKQKNKYTFESNVLLNFGKGSKGKKNNKYS